MTFYHRTRSERWEAIQEEGVLWGVHGWDWDVSNKNKTTDKWKPYRYTYLAPEIPDDSYGDVILEVQYEPLREDFGTKHNYGFDPPPGQHCWQFSVFEPISLSCVRRI